MGKINHVSCHELKYGNCFIVRPRFNEESMVVIPIMAHSADEILTNRYYLNRRNIRYNYNYAEPSCNAAVLIPTISIMREHSP
jgi:3'-phosphoadenosine 5'-phosphosulfate sulfotransferase (PAPS reductase)/FAD synthetase